MTRVVPGAKLDAESDFEVRFAVAPQKLDQNHAKLIFRSKQIALFFRRGKVKYWELSETRFPKFLHRSEPCLRRNRAFKVFSQGYVGLTNMFLKAK